MGVKCFLRRFQITEDNSMRFKVAALAVCLCSFVGMGLSVRTPATQNTARSSVRAVVFADGGAPVPPWPGSGSLPVAQGIPASFTV